MRWHLGLSISHAEFLKNGLVEPMHAIGFNIVVLVHELDAGSYGLDNSLLLVGIGCEEATEFSGSHHLILLVLALLLVAMIVEVCL